MNAARSLRLVFATLGSRGDVQPMIALALAAAARGHRPLVAAPVNFGGWVRSVGLEFATFGIDVQQYLADNPRFLAAGTLSTLREMKRMGEEFMPQQVRELRAAVEGADGLLWSGLAFMAPTVAEWARLPALGVAYTTAWFRTDDHPPPAVSWTTAPRWLNRLMWIAHDWFIDRFMPGPLMAERKALGLPPVPLLEHIRDEPAYVLAVDAGVLPSDPLWGRRFHRANFIFFEDPRDLDPALDEWLRAGEPPVFAGFGSMNGHGPKRAAQAFIDAFAASGRRCLVGAGWAGVGAELPPGWRVVGDVPHAKLFPRAAAVIHHGGSGTMACALRAGVPQVVLPLLVDQFLHGRLLHDAGLGARPVPMEKITAPVLAERVAQALALPAGPRLEVARRLQASNGCAQVLDLAEAMCVQSPARRDVVADAPAAEAHSN